MSLQTWLIRTISMVQLFDHVDKFLSLPGVGIVVNLEN